MLKRQMAACLIAAMLGTTWMPMHVAAAGSVARIGNTEYATLDEAVAAAADGDTIEVLANCTTSGLNLSKNLTIEGAAGIDPTISFEKGIALWGKELSFKDCNVEMIGVGTTAYTAEWNWMTICASKDSVMNLENATMTLDGTGTSNKHAIYFCGNDKLNLDNSELVIKNYEQDALEWDGGNGGYNINFVDSKFTSDYCRSGFTGSFYVTAENSEIDVINSRGNGSNGSHFIVKHSDVNFSDNTDHGLSASKLYISDDSVVTTNNNGRNGIVARDIQIDGTSTVHVEGNTSNSGNVGAFRVMGSTGKCEIEEGADVKIINNYMSGIQVDHAAGVMVMNAGVVTGNGRSSENGYGGGARIMGSFTASDEVRIHNNHASNAGDDIYVYEGGSAVLSDAQSDEQILLEDCGHVINGWYDDGADLRWDADTTVESKQHIVRVTDGLANIAGAMALKAAHDLDSKTSYPGLIKKIVEGDTPADLTDATSAAKGEEVNFKLSSNVPQDLENYLELPEVATPSIARAAALSLEDRGSYELIFHDVMDEALVLDEASIKVMLGDTELSEGDYSVDIPGEDGETFTVTIDLVALYETGKITEDDLGEKAIVVTYTATLKTDIAAGTYENEAYVTYPGDDSEHDIVTVDTFKLTIFKYDQAASDKGLAGAEFELYQKAEDGTRIDVATLVSGDDGYISEDGLKEGTYYLKETKAPDNYVGNDTELEVKISSSTVTEHEVTVKFANGLIPHTGGQGTGLYTVVGLVVMVGAAGAFLIYRRKKNKN